MFRKLIFSRITLGDYFTMLCFTKDNNAIVIKFDELLDTQLRNKGINLDDNDLIKYMAFEAKRNKTDFFIDEKNYTEDWMDFKINEDCIIETMNKNTFGIIA